MKKIRKGKSVFITYKMFRAISDAFDQVTTNIESSDEEYAQSWEKGLKEWNKFYNKFYDIKEDIK